MIDNSRYRTVSIPSALSARMDFLMDELGYWLSYDVFVRETLSGEDLRGGADFEGARESQGEDSPIRTGGGAPSGD